MQSGRIEGRTAMSIAAHLEIPGEPTVVERVVIKNLSTYGACLVGKRTCRVDDFVVIRDLLGTFRIDARVIYCSVSLLDGQCAIGVQFREAAPDYLR